MIAFGPLNHPQRIPPADMMKKCLTEYFQQRLATNLTGSSPQYTPIKWSFSFTCPKRNLRYSGWYRLGKEKMLYSSRQELNAILSRPSTSPRKGSMEILGNITGRLNNILLNFTF